jgi:DNA polymerase-3 subunit epsilon
MKDFAAIDFETANSNRSSVCSVGIVVVRDGVVTDKIYELIRPAPNYYSWWATDIHGLGYNDTAGAETFPDVWRKIAPLIEGLPLVAHNSPFDEGCLRRVHAHYGMEYPEYKFHCTCRMVRKAFLGLADYRLPTVAAHVGFDFTNHHHALSDAEACAAIATRIFS